MGLQDCLEIGFGGTTQTRDKAVSSTVLFYSSTCQHSLGADLVTTDHIVSKRPLSTLRSVKGSSKSHSCTLTALSLIYNSARIIHICDLSYVRFSLSLHNVNNLPHSHPILMFKDSRVLGTWRFLIIWPMTISFGS